jgi:hypothetical protein
MDRNSMAVAATHFLIEKLEHEHRPWLGFLPYAQLSDSDQNSVHSQEDMLKKN